MAYRDIGDDSGHRIWPRSSGMSYDILPQVIRSHAQVMWRHQRSQTVYWQLLWNEKRYTLADGLIVFVSSRCIYWHATWPTLWVIAWPWHVKISIWTPGVKKLSQCQARKLIFLVLPFASSSNRKITENMVFEMLRSMHRHQNNKWIVFP